MEERDIGEERGRDTNTEKKGLEKEGQIHQSHSHRWTKGQMDKEKHTCKEREREGERQLANRRNAEGLVLFLQNRDSTL